MNSSAKESRAPTNERRRSSQAASHHTLSICKFVLLAATLLVLTLFQSRIYFISGNFPSPASPIDEDLPPQAEDPPQQPRQQRKNKLGDGCHHIFIDAGANIGVHSRFLFEPDKYSDAQKALQIYDQHFGTHRDIRDFCTFAFEPNPAHTKRHEELAAAYQAVGMRYHPILAGVSDVDGTMSFYHQGFDKNKQENGFRSIKAKDKEQEEEVVPVIRLASWLRDEILDRTLPDQVYGSYGDDKAPKVVMKMDIEGMELIVLPDLISSGILCQTVDYVFMELHWWPLTLEAPTTSTATVTTSSGLRGGLHLPEGKMSRDFAKHLIQAFHAPRSGECKTTKIDLQDDESYLHDGIPFPEAPPK